MARALAGYRQFDVLLVNPIYDGMNLVAKEGVLCNRRDGVLVLSENAGLARGARRLRAHASTPSTSTRPPRRSTSGCSMDAAQKQARAERIRETVRAADINRWISLQLQDLRDLIVARRSRPLVAEGGEADHEEPADDGAGPHPEGGEAAVAEAAAGAAAAQVALAGPAARRCRWAVPGESGACGAC